jgi:hypothetical protein
MILGAAAALVSCATGDGETGPTVLHHTFDGEKCYSEGPQDLTAGPVVITFENNSNIDAALDFDRHTGDHTAQEAKDRIAAGKTHRPSWARPVTTYKSISPGTEYRWEGELEPGTHHSVIVIRPDGYVLYFCSGFEVAENGE